MSRLDGKVAVITGAGRGQGRAHAVRLAEDGADILAIDLCRDMGSVPYPLSRPEDLAETARLVAATGQNVVAAQADVRDTAAMEEALNEGRDRLGPIDIVVCNAAIAPMAVEPSDGEWDDVIAVNLTGVYTTVRLAIPAMIERGAGGSIVIISSLAGLAGMGGNSPGMLAYTASKHGVVGLTRAWANYLAPHNIRVNSVAPTGVRTPMVTNRAFSEYVASHEEFARSMGNALPGVDVVEPLDIANAVAWIASDDARYVTGHVLPVDAGALNIR